MPCFSIPAPLGIHKLHLYTELHLLLLLSICGMEAEASSSGVQQHRLKLSHVWFIMYFVLNLLVLSLIRMVTLSYDYTPMWLQVV